MTRRDTLVTTDFGPGEINEAKRVYVNSAEQAPTYPDPAPRYARVLADLIASLAPRSVLEFGCHAGRNLDQIRHRVPLCDLLGVDVNPQSAQLGRELFDHEIHVADEGWLARQQDDLVEVSFTVSVVDHVPYPETILRDLFRVTSRYVVLFELAHDRIGRATHTVEYNETGAVVLPAYRYSYIHDYRFECERKLGARCVVDLDFPIGEHNLVDLYRLYVFSVANDPRDDALIDSISLRPICRNG